MSFVVPENDLSFGEGFGQGGPYQPIPAPSKIPAEIVFTVFDETGQTLLRDPAQSFYYEYEVWPWRKQIGKSETLTGKGTANYDPKDPPGIVRFPVGGLPHDTEFPPGGHFTLKFLPKGQAPKPENYVPIMTKVLSFFHKAPAVSTAPLSLRMALDGKQQEYQTRQQPRTPSEIFNWILVGSGILVGAYLVYRYFQSKPAPEPPALPGA